MARLRKRDRRGAAMVEAALVIPIFFMFLLGLFEFARVAMLQQLMDSAAREGARLAIVSTQTMTTTQIQTTVTNCLAGQLKSPTIQVYKADPTTGANIDVWTNAQIGDCIAVEISGNYLPIVPKMSMVTNPLPLHAKAMRYCEAN
jgi:Flp pilus assembly protein TadG